MIDQVIEWGSNNPKKLFQLDGFGALLSSFLLGIVLVKFEPIFGIPKATLYLLASLPLLFVVYDVYCYYKVEHNLGPFLKGIAITNLLYCCTSIGLTTYHRANITPYGWGYILVEVLIVPGLSFIELKIANQLNS